MKFMVERTSGKEPPCQESEKTDTGWSVDIENLDALLMFITKYQSCVISPAWDKLDMALPTIEIYDDYRE